MNKTAVGVIIAIVAVLGIGGVVLLNKPNDEKNSSVTSSSSENGSSKDMDDMNMGSESVSPSSSDNSGPQDLTSKSEVSMDIKNFAFTQKQITVKKGTKVTWTNRDEAKHNAFSKTDGGPKGNLLATGESYSFTFDTVGTFNYFCEPHPYMKASVTVVE